MAIINLFYFPVMNFSKSIWSFVFMLPLVSMQNTQWTLGEYWLPRQSLLIKKKRKRMNMVDTKIFVLYFLIYILIPPKWDSSNSAPYNCHIIFPPVLEKDPGWKPANHVRPGCSNKHATFQFGRNVTGRPLLPTGRSYSDVLAKFIV